MLTVNWKGGMAFEAEPPSGNRFVMDGIPEIGGKDLGPTPVEALVASVAACSAIDVVLILEKKRQVITSYRIECEWFRGPQGQYPRPIEKLVVRHILTGENLDEGAVQKAVELSDEKYCTVISTLRANTEVSSEWTITE